MCRETIPPARTSDQDPSWAPPLEALRHILVCYSCESLTGCRSTRGSTLRSPETGGRGVNTAQSSRRQPGRDASGTRSGDTGSPASPRVDTGPASHRPARGEQGPPPPQARQLPAPARPGAVLPLGVIGRVPRRLLQQSHVAEHTGEDEEHRQGVGAPETQTHGWRQSPGRYRTWDARARPQLGNPGWEPAAGREERWRGGRRGLWLRGGGGPAGSGVEAAGSR